MRNFYNDNPNEIISAKSHPEEFKKMQGIFKVTGVTLAGASRGLKAKSGTHRLGEAELYLQNTKNNPYLKSTTNPLEQPNQKQSTTQQRQEMRNVLNPGVPNIVTLSDMTSNYTK